MFKGVILLPALTPTPHTPRPELLKRNTIASSPGAFWKDLTPSRETIPKDQPQREAQGKQRPDYHDT